MAQSPLDKRLAEHRPTPRTQLLAGTHKPAPVVPGERPLEHLLHERDAGRVLGVSVSWLQRQRWKRTGPPFCKVGGPKGRAVRYRPSDLQQWIEANRIDPTKARNNQG
jgi:hypothetical protein